MTRIPWPPRGTFLPAVGIAVLSLLLPTGLAGAQPTAPVRPAQPPGLLLTASSVGEAKLDRLLRAQVDAAERTGSDEIAYVAIKSDGPIDISGLAEKAVATRWPLGQVVTLAKIEVRRLPKVAAIDAVIFVEDAAHAELMTDEEIPSGMPPRADIQAQRRRLAELQRHEVPFDAAPPLVVESAGAVTAGPDSAADDLLASREPAAGTDAWNDVLVGHGSAKAWAQGWRGEGVRVGISDSGVDFATPELVGTWAVIEDAASPYAGWPQALEAQGLYQYVQDVQLGSSGAALGAGGVLAVSQTSGATRDFDGVQNGYGKACFRRVLQGDELVGGATCDYRVPWRSRSGVYRFAVHPDPYLVGLYGERPGVLVVDQGGSGSYDTVYVDLDNDHDFTDEKPATRDDPLVYRDMDGDGWADISGGLLYWIADGENPPPGAYLWPGLVPTPGRGEVVALIGPWDGSHGTMCASNVAGRGVVPVPDGINLRFRDLVMGRAPERLLVGAAPKAKIVAIRRGGLLVTEATYIYAALGHDPDRAGDELQVLSNSYGFSDIVNEGWDSTSRLVDYLNTVNAEISYVFSSGNGGPGYGSIRGAHPHSGLKVAASTQMGSTGYDSITDTLQITWGDIISFSSSGPGADGTAGTQVAADGAYAAGATVLNGVLDGRRTIVTWGGTSRSTPVAAGNLALVYQAFRERHGRWPSFIEARSLLMAGAVLNGYDPFTTGAGVIDGGVSAMIAGGRDGLYAYPPEIIPGDYRGALYGSFPRLVAPGEEQSVVLTLNNPSERDIEVQLAAKQSRRIGSHEFEWTSAPVTAESTVFSEVPDYLIPVPREQIPAGTELMAVRMLIPLEESDLGLNYTYGGADNLWFLRVYQHTDIDGDGLLWDDVDGDGVVDKRVLATSHQIDGLQDVDWSQTEIDRWEYERFGQDTRPNNNEVVWVHHPLERWADGMYIGLQHAARPAAKALTTIRFRLDFYRYEDWPWITIDRPNVTVPAGNSASVTVTAQVPADAPYGFSQGIIAATYTWETDTPLPPQPTPWGANAVFLPLARNDGVDGGGWQVEEGEGAGRAVVTGSGGSPPIPRPLSPTGGKGRRAVAEPVIGGAVRGLQQVGQGAVRQLNVPVQLNVAATLGAGSLDLVPPVAAGATGAHDPDLPYASGLVRGANRWNYGPESGDWRYFMLDVPAGQPTGTRLVLRGGWEDGKPPDREGTAVPRSDIDLLVYGPAADRWSDPSHPDNADQDLADPSFFGPYTTALAGGSVNANVRAGIWQFETATGDYEDWITAGLQAGLHVIMAHDTLIAGDRFAVPFSIALDTVRLWPEEVTAAGTAAACEPVSFAPSFALGGLVSDGYGLAPVEELRWQSVNQDDAGDVLSASWRRTFTVAHGSRIELVVDGRDEDDLDLFLYADANGDGLPQASEQVAASTSPEADEAIVYQRPPDGQYIVTVHGWSVPQDVTTFDLTMTVVQGRHVRAQGLPAGPIAAGQEVGFEICYDALIDAVPGRYVGELVFGPAAVAGLMRVGVEVEVGR